MLHLLYYARDPLQLPVFGPIWRRKNFRYYANLIIAIIEGIYYLLYAAIYYILKLLQTKRMLYVHKHGICQWRLFTIIDGNSNPLSYPQPRFVHPYYQPCLILLHNTIYSSIFYIRRVPAGNPCRANFVKKKVVSNIGSKLVVWKSLCCCAIFCCLKSPKGEFFWPCSYKYYYILLLTIVYLVYTTSYYYGYFPMHL